MSEGCLTSDNIEFVSGATTHVKATATPDTLTFVGDAAADVLLSGIAPPIDSNDAVNKGFVDEKTFKNAVKAASTGDVVLSPGTTPIDGVTISNGDRVLLKNQSTTTQNGIYILTGGDYIRTDDAITTFDAGGVFVAVTDGVVNADSLWQCTDPNGTLFNSGITFTEFTGGGGGGSGDVVGPVSSTDNAITRWDGNTGNLVQDSGVLLDDLNAITGLASIQFNGSTSGTVTIDVPAITTPYTMTLPDADGTNNQVMVTDGSGNLRYIGGILYDAIVDVNGGGDYTLLSDAVTAGEVTIYVRKGVYDESGAGSDIVLPDKAFVIGESKEGTVIDFGATDINFIISAVGESTTSYSQYTATTLSANVITVGASFTGTFVGGFMMLGDTYYEIAAVNGANDIDLVNVYQGDTITETGTFMAISQMNSGSIQNMSLRASGTGSSNLIDCTNARNIILRNLCFENSRNHAIRINDSTHALIDNCIINNCGNNGLVINFSTNCSFTNSIITNSLNGGIVIINSSRNLNFSNLIITDTDNDAIILTSGIKCQFTNIIIRRSDGKGMDLVTGEDIIVTNVIMGDCGNNGIEVSGVSGIITNCTVENCTDGIRCDTTSNVNVFGCTVRNNSAQGIDVNTTNITIANCTIDNNGNDGIRLLSASSKIIINACQIINNGAWGVDISASSVDNIILGNLVENNSSGTIRDLSSGDTTLLGNTDPVNILPGSLELAAVNDSGIPTLIGNQFAVDPRTYTDDTGGPTTTNAVFTSFAQSTLAATSATTTTNVATVYIAGAPIAGTNETITNAYALWIDSGSVRIDSDLTGLTNITASGTIQAGVFTDGTFTTSGGTFTGVNNITATGTIQGNSFTDGTITITGGTLSGLVNLTVSGTLQGNTITDGAFSSTAGVITGVTNLTASGTIQSGTFTDGTFTATSGAFTNVTTITASGTIEGGSITDGTFTATGGAFTGVTNITASGTIEGITLTDGTASMTGGTLTALNTPIDPDDAATKGYVDSLLNGLIFKAPVRCASTVNLTTLNVGQVIDGVTLVNGDRILVKNQNTLAVNGVWLAGSVTRALDFAAGIDGEGFTVLVQEGGQAGTTWVITDTPPFTLGTSDTIFTQNGISQNPGGANTNIQFNNLGGFGGDSNLTWTNGTQILAVNGTTSTTTLQLEGSTSGTITIDAPLAFTNYSLIMPSDDGNINEFLQTDGTGNLTWGLASATAGGIDTNVQYNNLGTIDGDSNFTWDDATQILTVNGTSVSDTFQLVGSTSGTINMNAPPVVTSYTLTFPINNGNSNDVLQTDGSGILTWAPVSASAGGSTNSVQFNNGGALDGDTNFTWNTGLQILNIDGTIQLPGSIAGVITLTSPSIITNYTLTLPDNDGNVNEFLQTNGSGVLSWETAVTSPAGIDTEIQYNDTGAFGADSNFTWNNTTQLFTIVGKQTIDSSTLSGVPTNDGSIFESASQIFTDNSGGPTTPIAVFNSFAQPTLAATSSTTTTEAATVYIEGPPGAGINETITNTYSLLVDSGDVQVNNNINVTQNITSDAIIQGTTLTDGNLSSTAGVVSGIISLTASGAITSGSITDGIATLSSGTLSGLISPSGPTDAANRAYVDSVASGLQFKDPCRVATIVNGILASAFDNNSIVDGVTLVTSDRIMLKDQSNQIENGLYIVQGSGAPIRTLDMAIGVNAETFAVLVQEGSNSGTSWVITGTSPFTVNTSNIVWTQFAGGVQITAGEALEKVGNTFNVLYDDSTINLSTNELQIKDLGIVAGKLATDSITTIKILDANVTNAKLANDSITVTAGDGLQNGGNVSLGATITLDVDATVARTFGNQSFSGIQTNTNATNSTNKDNGAIVIENGGLGVEGNINAGGDIDALGDLSSVNVTASGTVSGLNGTFSNNLSLSAIPLDRVLYTGTGGLIESNAGFTWDDTSLSVTEVNSQTITRPTDGSLASLWGDGIGDINIGTSSTGTLQFGNGPALTLTQSSSTLQSELTIQGNFSRKYSTTNTNTATNIVYSAIQLLNGIIFRDPNGANRIDTTDTATNIVNIVTDAVVGSSIRCVIENISDALGEIITINGGTGVTLNSPLILKPGNRAEILLIFDNIGSPAITLYTLSITSKYKNGMITTITTTPYTILITDEIINVDTLTIGTASVINLPPIGVAGNIEFTITDSSGGSTNNNITINPDGSETILGDTEAILIEDYTSITIYNDGSTNWLLK